MPDAIGDAKTFYEMTNQYLISSGYRFIYVSKETFDIYFENALKRDWPMVFGVKTEKIFVRIFAPKHKWDRTKNGYWKHAK